MSSSTSASDPSGRGPIALLGRSIGFALLIVLAVYLVALWGGPGSRVDYMAGQMAKHQRAQSLPSPKVIVIGGSNAAFGIDSEQLEDALCQPVVNMAIHADLNFDHMVDEVKQSLGAGDLILAPLELSLYSKSYGLNDVHYQAVDQFPPALCHISGYHWPKILMVVGVLRTQATWRNLLGLNWIEPEPIYRADGFNASGDLVSHLDSSLEPELRDVEKKPFAERTSKDFERAARDLAVYARAAGAEVRYCWPAIAEVIHAQEAEPIIREALAQQGHIIIGSMSDYVYPDTAFFDTPYHLRSRGRSLRTAQLIRDLCAAIPSRCCVATKD